MVSPINLFSITGIDFRASPLTAYKLCLDIIELRSICNEYDYFHKNTDSCWTQYGLMCSQNQLMPIVNALTRQIIELPTPGKHL